MTIIPGTEDRLSKQDMAEAIELKRLREGIIRDQKEWCYRLAQAVEKRGPRLVQPFLTVVMPEASTTQRKDLLLAGQEISRILAGRPAEIAEIPYGTSVLRDIALLPMENRAWAYEKKRSQREIRAYKKALKNPEPKEDEVLANDYAKAEEVNASNNGVIAAQQAVIDELSAENQRLRNSTLTETNDLLREQSVPTTLLTTLEEYEEPDDGKDSIPPIDFDWHPGIQVGSEECDDFNRIHRLISEASKIQAKYAFTGIFGPREWCSLLGAYEGIAACANAQRRYKPGPKQGAVVDIG